MLMLERFFNRRGRTLQKARRLLIRWPHVWRAKLFASAIDGVPDLRNRWEQDPQSFNEHDLDRLLVHCDLKIADAGGVIYQVQGLLVNRAVWQFSYQGDTLTVRFRGR